MLVLYSFEVAETGIRTYFMNLSGKVQQSIKFHRRYVSGFGGIFSTWGKMHPLEIQASQPMAGFLEQLPADKSLKYLDLSEPRLSSQCGGDEEVETLPPVLHNVQFLDRNTFYTYTLNSVYVRIAMIVVHHT